MPTFLQFHVQYHGLDHQVSSVIFSSVDLAEDYWNLLAVLPSESNENTVKSTKTTTKIKAITLFRTSFARLILFFLHFLYPLSLKTETSFVTVWKWSFRSVSVSAKGGLKYMHFTIITSNHAVYCNILCNKDWSSKVKICFYKNFYFCSLWLKNYNPSSRPLL